MTSERYLISSQIEDLPEVTHSNNAVVAQFQLHNIAESHSFPNWLSHFGEVIHRAEYRSVDRSDVEPVTTMDIFIFHKCGYGGFSPPWIANPAQLSLTLHFFDAHPELVVQKIP